MACVRRAGRATDVTLIGRTGRARPQSSNLIIRRIYDPTDGRLVWPPTDDRAGRPEREARRRIIARTFQKHRAVRARLGASQNTDCGRHGTPPGRASWRRSCSSRGARTGARPSQAARKVDRLPRAELRDNLVVNLALRRAQGWRWAGPSARAAPASCSRVPSVRLLQRGGETRTWRYGSQDNHASTARHQRAMVEHDMSPVGERSRSLPWLSAEPSRALCWRAGRHREVQRHGPHWFKAYLGGCRAVWPRRSLLTVSTWRNLRTWQVPIMALSGRELRGDRGGPSVTPILGRQTGRGKTTYSRLVLSGTCAGHPQKGTITRAGPTRSRA